MTSAKKRILVADDTPALLFLIRATLTDAGFDVVAAQDGHAAWIAVTQSDFDLVVTDYQMPGMDGFEFCRRMRRDARLAQIPVLLLTAKMFEIDVDDVQAQLGLLTVLSKPFSPRELTRWVKERLGSCSV
jgi:two-component system chemotaxis response regulator CheY